MPSLIQQCSWNHTRKGFSQQVPNKQLMIRDIWQGSAKPGLHSISPKAWIFFLHIRGVPAGWLKYLGSLSSWFSAVQRMAGFWNSSLGSRPSAPLRRNVYQLTEMAIVKGGTTPTSLPSYPRLSLWWKAVENTKPCCRCWFLAVSFEAGIHNSMSTKQQNSQDLLKSYWRFYLLVNTIELIIAKT